jgi:hypothetical protein
MEQHIKETAEQTIDGLKWGGEDVYIVARKHSVRKTILKAVKELSGFPFYYLEGDDHYVLFPSKCCVVDKNYEPQEMVWPKKDGSFKTNWTDTYKNCRRYIGRKVGELDLQIALVADDNEHHCFTERNNWS